MAFIKKFCSTGQVWLSVYSNGSLLGLRTDKSIPQPPPPDEQPAATAGEGGETADEKADLNVELDNKNPRSAEGGNTTQENAEDNSTVVTSISQMPSLATGTAYTHDTTQLIGSTCIKSLLSELGCFFCHTEDDVRIIAYPGPSPTPTKKPDKLGTACLALTYPYGLTVNACSNGNIKIESLSVSAVPLRKKAAALEPLLYERNRGNKFDLCIMYLPAEC